MDGGVYGYGIRDGPGLYVLYIHCIRGVLQQDGLLQTSAYITIMNGHAGYVATSYE